MNQSSISEIKCNNKLSKMLMSKEKEKNSINSNALNKMLKFSNEWENETDFFKRIQIIKKYNN